MNTRARNDGRGQAQLRPIEIQTGFTKWAEGSVLIGYGDTKVLCTASVEDRVASWLKDQRPGQGWVTAEYSMLPRATEDRNARESVKGKLGGRTQEISRLIGRSLRGVIDLQKLGERSITLDCDVIQADGGTRTAAITGAFVALCLALERMKERGMLGADPIREHLAAVSVGIVGGDLLVDLAAEEDQRADTDLNLVMTASSKIVEIQATAEKVPFSKETFDRLLQLGAKAIQELVVAQHKALGR